MESAEVCRDRFGTFSVAMFQVWTCSLCYKYLFPPDTFSSKSSPASSSSPSPSSAAGGSSSSSGMGIIVSPTGEEIVPDTTNVSSIHAVCSWMDADKCTRWLQCCHTAVQCCHRQIADMLYNPINETLKNSTASQSFGADDGGLGLAWSRPGGSYGGGGSAGVGGGVVCPQTWDGFSCIDQTPAGSLASVSCPTYLEQTQMTARGYRLCTDNGTWWLDPATGHEWTDYTACVPLEDYYLLYVVGTVCNALSLVLLLPASVIFMSYRSLRKQHRIRIHANLFLSLLVTNASLLLWENLVYRDRLSSDASESNMHGNTVSCKVLYFVTRYAWSSAFFWMFLEGFHLYRLISRAFQTPVTILPYYVFGWGMSLVPVIAYVTVRAVLQHDSCWVKNAGPFEWIIYGPELLCILLNVFFFICILRILVTEIQAHPNEPSNFRRALKATFFLVPLFGIQLFMVAYNPGPVLAHMVYEVAAKMVSSLQGAVVSIIFCFCNSEVHGQLRSTCNARCRQYPHTVDMRSITVASHLTTVESTRGSYSLPKSASARSSVHSATHLDRLDRTSYIALNAWANTHSATH